MNEWRLLPEIGTSQSLIILNFDLDGQLPTGVRSWPTYSTLFKRNLHLSKRKITLYLLRNLHTHSRYTMITTKLLLHMRTSSIIAFVPVFIFVSPVYIYHFLPNEPVSHQAWVLCLLDYATLQWIIYPIQI